MEDKKSNTHIKKIKYSTDELDKLVKRLKKYTIGEISNKRYRAAKRYIKDILKLKIPFNKKIS